MANKPQRPDQKVVFGITTETGTDNMVIVLQVPPGGWEYMQDGTCHTFDLSNVGVPVKIMLAGCKDRAEAVRNIEAANAAKGHGTLNMAGTVMIPNTNSPPPPDTKVLRDHLADLEIKIEAALRDMVGRGATPSILVGSQRWQIAKAVTTALQFHFISLKG